MKIKRKELVEVLEKQEKPVKLEGFTTEELDEILFDYEEEERIKKLLLYQQMFYERLICLM